MNYVKIVAIAGLTVIESLALIMRVDGSMLTIVVAAIAGLAGYEVGKGGRA